MYILKKESFKKIIVFTLIFSFIFPIFTSINRDVHAINTKSNLEQFIITLNENNFDYKKTELENKIINTLQSQGFSKDESIYILKKNPLKKDEFLNEIKYDLINKGDNISLFNNNGDKRYGAKITITASSLNALGFSVTISSNILGWGLSKSEWASAIVATVGWKVIFGAGVLIAIAGYLAYKELYGYSKVIIQFIEYYQYDEYEGFGKWYIVDADVSKEK